MPHVTIKCYKGRSEEVKQECAQKVAQDISEIMGCPITAVSVAIKEYDQEEWKPQVWDKEIAPEMDELYRKPGYTCE